MNLFPCHDDQSGRPGKIFMNNSSMFTADRGTHLKIVVVSVVCAAIVSGIGIAARGKVPDGRIEATVITAGKPVTAVKDASTSIR
jgi:hypothetical protein